MNNEWIFIKNKEPEEGQEVWYCFPILKCVFSGFFCHVDLSETFNKEKGTIILQQFYSKNGFLTNEKVYWMDKKNNSIKPELPYCNNIDWELISDNKNKILESLQINYLLD